MINILIQNASWCRILKNPEHYSILFDILSYKDKTRDYLTGRVVNIVRSVFDKRYGGFPTGLLNYVLKELDKKEIKYSITDTNSIINLSCKKNVKLKNITFNKYQKEVLEKIQLKSRGIISSSTGSGKSAMIAGVIEQCDKPPTLIIVPTKDIAWQMIETLQKELGIAVGIIGDSEIKLKQITVGLYQSIIKCDLEMLNKRFKLLIVDEAHKTSAKTIQNILKKMTNIWYRYGFTGTAIQPNQRKEWLQITGQLGEVFINISDEEASERVITDVEIIMCRNTYAVSSNDYHEQYRKNILLDDNRCDLLARMINDALHSRSNCLLLVDEYKQALKIKHFYEECYEKYSKKSVNPVIAWSGCSTEELRKIKEDLNSSKLKLCIATPVFSIGTDIVGIESIVLGSARKSKVNTIQKIGRGRRKIEGKNSLLVYDVYDILHPSCFGKTKPYFENFSKDRFKIYKSKKWKVSIM